MAHDSLFALVDCNNFYASCERVFNPKLAGKAIVVLSNNDGCIVARSNEAKALGIGMAGTFFEAKQLIEKHKVCVFSSNYALYGDMSSRVFETLRQFTPEMEIYSIDETFLNLSGFTGRNLTEYARRMRKTVRQWTGIPISVGIAETKVLAKIANRVAKRMPAADGVYDLTIGNRREEALAMTRVENIWGIGRRLAKRLAPHGITTALDLCKADDLLIRKRLGVVGARIVTELRGISCLPLEMAVPPRKGITCSRSFGRPVVDLNEMKEAVAAYVSRAAVKLRRQQSSTRCMTVFTVKTQFLDGKPQPSKEVTIELPFATDNTRELMHAAMTGMEQIFEPGNRYRKAGVILTDITPTCESQRDMFDPVDRKRSQQLMATIDAINRRLGVRTLHFAAQGQTQPWHMKCEMRSSGYTVDWAGLVVVRA